jgi:hypothetical protein
MFNSLEEFDRMISGGLAENAKTIEKKDIALVLGTMRGGKSTLVPYQHSNLG